MMEASTSAPTPVVRATPSSVLFRDWKREGTARSRTLLLKVERPGPVSVTASQCLTPCFKAEVVGQEQYDTDDEGAEGSVDHQKELLVAKDGLQRGTVIQIRITLSPPAELLQVEENFKDCIVIVANGSVVEVPVYALGKIRNKNGFEVIDNLDKVKHWPKKEILQNLVTSFLGSQRILPPTPSTAYLSHPASRQTAASSRSAGTGLEPDAFGRTSLNSTCGPSSLSMQSLTLNGETSAAMMNHGQGTRLARLTSSNIAFEIDGIFYNTLGAEVGRLAETTSIIHLNDVEVGEDAAEAEALDENERYVDQELDLEESQVIADQQIIASQLVSYLQEMDQNIEDFDEQALHMPSNSQASSAYTSYAGTRINTPRMVPPLPHQKQNSVQYYRSNSSSAASARQQQVKDLQRQVDGSPKNSRISQREMQANWDSIPGI
ncbi:hypothetical protein HOP50_17g79400 [Chloropicon primus]|uniref:Uncharacterized protein n=1 Tax=Chloropicon primus TaxID=1764295 RepID=A0A5B8N0R7_9CHLO|nr:hypothetical protein A3770_17p79180 [Chloropicon primus]UPR04598.1 hypothetical protein HOP50_17g79400 [Chloropicon primus]|eukprot:QDZ25400.1 hypothetical protein A3770_17p79180 [Chloropicon primus]